MQPPTNLCTDSDELNFDTPTIQENLDAYNNSTYQSSTSVTQFYQIYSDSDNDYNISTLNRRLKYKKIQKTISKRRNRAGKALSLKKQTNNQSDCKNTIDEESAMLQATRMHEKLLENLSPEFSEFDESNDFLLTNEEETPEVLIQYIKILLKDAVQKEQKIKELQEEFDRRKKEINNLNAIYEKLKKKK